MTTKEQVIKIVNNIYLNLKDNISLFSKEATLTITQVNDEIEYIFSQLRNRIETEVTEPQVKQLVWEENEAIAFTVGKDDYKYQIEMLFSSQGGYPFLITLNDSYITHRATLDEAKAYAQKHFEGLIKSCLEGV